MKLRPITCLNHPFPVQVVRKDKTSSYEQLITRFGLTSEKAKELLYGKS